FFDRFNPSRVLPLKKWKEASSPEPDVLSPSMDKPVSDVILASHVHLTPIASTRPLFRFGALYRAELKLLLKGQHWWWYAATLGLIIAQFASELESARILLAGTWLWPILLLSGLGSREVRHNTYQIVFSAPRPILHQLPAMWLAAFTLIALMGSGAFLNFLLAGETTSLLAWLSGALFIPSLALAVGVLTGSSKAFEVIYVIWMYIIVQKVPALDFVGVVSDSPWYVYALLALALCTLCAFARQRQWGTRHISG
ncbi:MAG: hypothetical protein OEM41_05680, partial [Ignavibacteria bacterium]|nr:hypothetical protein [Ignavibacteria bacterium]